MGYKFNPFTGNLDVVDTTAAAGATTQVQFNDAGAFGGDSGLTFNKTTDALSAGGFIPTSSTVPANGVYLPAANSVGVATNGTGRLFVDANGFVGIGAVNIGSTGAQLSTTTTNSTARLIVESTNAAGYTGLRVANGTGHWEMQVDGANQGLRWLDDGSERLRITSAGLVGIGTSAPDVVLDVRTGAAGFGQFVHASGLGGVRIAGTGQFSASSLVFANNHSAGVVDGYTIQLDGANQSLKFLSGGTAATARMTLLSDGKVGIGNTAPGQALDVVGSINLTGNHTFSTTTSPLIAATAASSVLRFGTGSGGTERFRCDSSGRLLVGTSTSVSTQAGFTPSIQVAGTGALAAMSAQRYAASPSGPGFVFQKSRSGTIGSQAVLVSGDTFGSLTFEGSDGSAFQKGAQIDAEVDGTPGANDMPGRLVFSTTADGAASPTERMRISSAGDVFLRQAGGAERVYFTSAGSASIGPSSYAASSTTLYIGNAAIQVTSDQRLKRDIANTALEAAEELKKLRVVDFTWDDPSDTSFNNKNARGRWTGILAQELVEVFPFAVNAPRKEEDLSVDYDSKETWTVNQDQLVPVLVKAFQQAMERIETLEGMVAVNNITIDEQQHQLSTLAARLTALESA
jgi:hypothetical protein